MSVTRRSRRPAFRGAVVMVAAAVLVLPATAGAEDTKADPVDGADPNEAAIGLGPMYFPFSPAPGQQVSFPHAASLDTVVDGERRQKVLLSYSAVPDVATVDARNQLIVSHDDGRTFLDAREDNIATSNVARLASGDVIAVDYIPKWDAEKQEATIVSRISGDLGDSWQAREGKVTLPEGDEFSDALFNRGLRVHKGVLQLADGTVLLGIYTRLAGDPRGRTLLLQSTDEGRSWTVRGRVGEPTSTGGTNEIAFSRTADGRLIAILRGDPQSSGLVQSYSTDDGRTWSDPVRVPAETTTVRGAVEPSIHLQPNGVLVLAYGRPRNHVLVSPSGNGDDWTLYQLAQDNVPDENAAAVHGSSANGTMISLSNSRSLVMSDTCAPWGCATLNESYAIWARTIDTVTPGTGRIDLRTGLREGRVKITGIFAPTPDGFPQTRPAGAVDESSDEFATAKLAGKKPQLTLELDRTYSVNRIGLMLQRGVRQDAVVQVSADGRSWSRPVITATDRVDYALRYADVPATQVKYVRVSGKQGSLVGVNELEVYASDVHTFENDPINLAPRGWSNTVYATVTDVAPTLTADRTVGYHSQRALRLLDLSPTDIARAVREFPSTSALDMSMQVSGITPNGGFLWTIRGSNADGDMVDAWHFWIDQRNGKVSVHDGSSWDELGTLPDGIEPAAWYEASLHADLSSATLTIADKEFETQVTSAEAVDLSSVQLSSVGTAFTGSSFYFDDVSVRP